MFMAEELDAGDLLLQAETPMGEEETSGELYERLSVLGATLLHDTVEGLLAGTVHPQPQDPALVTYAPMLEKSLSSLDFTQPAAKLQHLICGLSPWPGASTLLDGKVLKVHRARLAQGASGEAGTVLDEKRLIVACGEGALELLEVQLEGNKRLSASDFLRGHPLPVGKHLG
jgi:methionyl-tRNA formyltransferase